MVVIKEKNEDFCVEEVMKLHLEDGGNFAYYSLKKKGHNTLDALFRVAAYLGIPVHCIGYAGNKDRHAVTTQYISLPYKEAREKNISRDNNTIRMQYIGRGSEPVYLGKNDGNAFVIVVRNVTQKPIRPKTFYNFFGKQRFGQRNIEIGKALVTQRFDDAIALIQEGKGSAWRVLSTYTNLTATERLRKLQTKLLKLYVNAYQAYLWNMWLARRIRSNNVPETLPLPGFGCEGNTELEGIFEEEGITSRDFIIRQLPHISAEPLLRDTTVTPHDMSISLCEVDECYPETQKYTLRFFLPKGSYATVIIDHVFPDSRAVTM